MRTFFYISAVLTLLCVLGIGSTAVWLTGTNAGARWLLELADGADGVELSYDRLEGSLADQLRIENLQVGWVDGQFLVRRLHYRVSSLGLFPLRLELALFEAEQPIIRIGDEESEAGDPVGIEIIPLWLQARVESLKISDFLYQELNDPEDETVIADLIAGTYELSDKRLKASGFSYHSPYVHLDGDFDWQLSHPHLVMDARVFLPETVVDPELFDSIRVPVAFPGRLEVDGDWNHYVGPAHFGAAGGSGDEVRLSAVVDGSWQGLRLEGLKGKYLRGDVAGSLEMSWLDEYRLQGSIAAAALDPADLLEKLDGKLTFDAGGSLLVPYDDSPMTSQLVIDLQQGELNGHPVRGLIGGEWQETRLEKLDLELTSGDNQIRARGTVAERLDVDISLDRLSQLYPDLRGNIGAAGWLQWADDSLSGEIAGRGAELSWLDLSVAALEFRAQQLAEGESLSVEIEGENWRYGTWLIEDGSARLAGDAENHSLAVAVRSPAGRLEGVMSGHYSESLWQAELKSLTAEGQHWGHWTMPRSATVVGRNGTFSLRGLRLQEEAGGQLAAEFSGLGGDGELRCRLNWDDVAMDWLAKVLPLKTLSAKSTGELRYEAVGAQPRLIKGHVSSSGRVEDRDFELIYQDLDMEFSWSEEGLSLTGDFETDSGETLTASASSAQPPQLSWPLKNLKADIGWQGVNLERLNILLESATVEGSSDGSAHFEIAGYEPVRIGLHIGASGRMIGDEHELGPRDLSLNLHWSEQRFRCGAQIEGMLGGAAWLSLTSTADPTFDWPAFGDVEMEIDGLNLAALKPLLPQEIDLTGLFDGEVQGRWFERSRFALSGSLDLKDSHLGWESEQGQVGLPIDEAEVEWQWLDEEFQGRWEIALAEQNYLEGEWSLPVSAQLPPQLYPDQPLLVSMEGQVQAIGSLTTIGPWLVQELSGEVTTRVMLAGSWDAPVLSGHLDFREGGAYLPATGIQLEDVSLEFELEDNQVILKQLSLSSGPGELLGRGSLTLQGWQLAGYELVISGSDLQLLNFPEVNLLINPNLALYGDRKNFSMLGTVHVPTLEIRGGMSAQMIQPSKDVVNTTEEQLRSELSVATDVRVDVTLGDKVTLKTSGADVRLAGGAVVTMDSRGELLAWGDVNLVSGIYRGYGARLEVRQGVLHYAGDPVDNPHLKIFAAREIGNVLAGVQITGTAEEPVVTLYSRPAMPERDIFGYIFMGRAIGTETEDSEMVALGAGMLMPGSGGALEKLGFTEIDLQGLFVGSEGVRLRKRLKEQWEVETTLGSESGIDLFYVIEFD